MLGCWAEGDKGPRFCTCVSGAAGTPRQEWPTGKRLSCRGMLGHVSPAGHIKDDVCAGKDSTCVAQHVRCEHFKGTGHTPTHMHKLPH